MVKGGANKGRDERGRFTAGNSGGPGGARRRAFTLRRAAEEAISDEHVAAMIRKATRMALEGNLSAMRLVLDRVCGRPAEATETAEPVPVKFPDLHGTADCNDATDRVIDSILDGTIDRTTAKLLLDAIRVRVKAIETHEIALEFERLKETVAEIEKGRPCG